jgi:hypothetical protein
MISSNRLTMNCSVANCHDVMPWMSRIGCAYGMTRARRSVCVSGNSVEAIEAIVVSSACACAIMTPGASRPKMKIVGPCRRGYCDGSMRSGVQ